MEKQTEERIAEVAKAIADFVRDGQPFEIGRGVHVFDGRELNLTAEDDGRELVAEDTLHIIDDDGIIEMHVSAERIAEILAGQKDPADMAYWVPNPDYN